jgi:hypothetical protein
MDSVIFTCPITSLRVQHWLQDGENASETEFDGISCIACTRLHFINRKTGKILGGRKK